MRHERATHQSGYNRVCLLEIAVYLGIDRIFAERWARVIQAGINSVTLVYAFSVTLVAYA